MAGAEELGVVSGRADKVSPGGLGTVGIGVLETRRRGLGAQRGAASTVIRRVHGVVTSRTGGKFWKNMPVLVGSLGVRGFERFGNAASISFSYSPGRGIAVVLNSGAFNGAALLRTFG